MGFSGLGPSAETIEPVAGPNGLTEFESGLHHDTLARKNIGLVGFFSLSIYDHVIDKIISDIEIKLLW